MFHLPIHMDLLILGSLEPIIKLESHKHRSWSVGVVESVSNTTNTMWFNPILLVILYVLLSRNSFMYAVCLWLLLVWVQICFSASFVKKIMIHEQSFQATLPPESVRNSSWFSLKWEQNVRVVKLKSMVLSLHHAYRGISRL